MGLFNDLIRSVDAILAADSAPRRPRQPDRQIRAQQIVSTLRRHGIDVWRPDGMAADAFLLTPPSALSRQGILVRVADTHLEVSAHDRMGQSIYQERAMIGGRSPTETAMRILTLADKAAISLGMDKLSAPPRQEAELIPGQML